MKMIALVAAPIATTVQIIRECADRTCGLGGRGHQAGTEKHLNKLGQIVWPVKRRPFCGR